MSGLFQVKSGIGQAVHICRWASILSSSLIGYKLIDDSLSVKKFGLPHIRVGSTFMEARHHSKRQSYPSISNPNYVTHRGFKFALESIFRKPVGACHFSTTSRQMYASGRNQSPINIITSNVKEGSDLKRLKFSESWDKLMIGTVKNTGYYLSFTPEAAAERCTLETYNGMYVLDHVHCHWGSKEGEGAEHLIDGKQYDIEFHFVHKKLGQTNPVTSDGLSVLGVFGKADKNTKSSGIWDLLSPLQVIPYHSKSNVAGVTFSKLLPDVRDYYHYKGSLTVPSYDEVVHWFVLKEPIMVPCDYLEDLRQMNADVNGSFIECNHRGAQELHNRTVEMFVSNTSHNFDRQEVNVDNLTSSLHSSDAFIRELVKKISW